MITWALNSDNDIFIDKGSLKTVDEGAALIQRIKNQLQTYFEEWYLDTAIGVPYTQKMLKKNPDIGYINSELKYQILLVPGVLEILAFSSEYSTTAVRTLNATYSVLDIYGTHQGATIDL